MRTEARAGVGEALRRLPRRPQLARWPRGAERRVGPAGAGAGRGGGTRGELPQQRGVVRHVARADVRLGGPLVALGHGLAQQPVLQRRHGHDRVDGADGLHVGLLPLPWQEADLRPQELQHQPLDLAVLDAVQSLEDEGGLVVDEVLPHALGRVLAQQVQDLKEPQSRTGRPRRRQPPALPGQAAPRCRHLQALQHGRRVARLDGAGEVLVQELEDDQRPVGVRDELRQRGELLRGRPPRLLQEDQDDAADRRGHDLPVPLRLHRLLGHGLFERQETRLGHSLLAGGGDVALARHVHDARVALDVGAGGQQQPQEQDHGLGQAREDEAVEPLERRGGRAAERVDVYAGRPARSAPAALASSRRERSGLPPRCSHPGALGGAHDRRG
mmetsp:Transcript_49188/g.146926  ORF Transcript_49188/g.146926 Transcript_49188/m.146926 type:complete len:386 (+) Transcript_49188:402-1559(+)